VKPRTQGADRSPPIHRARNASPGGGTGGGAASASANASSSGIQRLVAHRARAGSKVQQRFARLVKQVDQRKRRLRAWYDTQPAIQRELAEYHAALNAYRRTNHDLVLLCDRVHAHPIFTRADRERLRAFICQVAGDLLAEPGFEDLKPIYNQHSRSDFDAEAAFGDAVNARVMRSMMEEMFGIDFGDADVSSTEKLQAFTEAQLKAIEQQEADGEQEPAQAAGRRSRRKKSARQVEREAEREAEQTRIGKVLQDVFRKLAVALHPDLEQDPTERVRKTELMQQVNVAYEAKDLLRLLELQLELEQIDPDHASGVAEDRLRHYNAILDQQVKQLDVELDELEMPWRLELDLAPPAPITPAEMLGRIHDDAEDMRREHAALRRQLDSFQDVTRLKAWLRSQTRRRSARPQADLFD
jgi:hypothetical protein